MDRIAFALRTGQITRSDYMGISGLSQATASRDLVAMVEAGILLAEGKTRPGFMSQIPNIFLPNNKYQQNNYRRFIKVLIRIILDYSFCLTYNPREEFLI